MAATIGMARYEATTRSGGAKGGAGSRSGWQRSARESSVGREAAEWITKIAGTSKNVSDPDLFENPEMRPARGDPRVRTPQDSRDLVQGKAQRLFAWASDGLSLIHI